MGVVDYKEIINVILNVETSEPKLNHFTKKLFSFLPLKLTKDYIYRTYNGYISESDIVDLKHAISLIQETASSTAIIHGCGASFSSLIDVCGLVLQNKVNSNRRELPEKFQSAALIVNFWNSRERMSNEDKLILALADIDVESWGAKKVLY